MIAEKGRKNRVKVVEIFIALLQVEFFPCAVSIIKQAIFSYTYVRELMQQREKPAIYRIIRINKNQGCISINDGKGPKFFYIKWTMSIITYDSTHHHN